MNYQRKLRDIIEENNGLILTKSVVESGIPRQYLSNFVKEGLLERIAHGVYISPSSFEDEMYILQSINNRAIFSHETSLYLHDLTDRDPINLSVTVPSGYNASKLKEDGLDVYFIKKELYDLGIMGSKTVYGRPIFIYNKERTICDIVRSRSSIDISILNEGLKRYVEDKEKNIPLLMRYAKQMNIQTILRRYMEVLLWEIHNKLKI